MNFLSGEEQALLDELFQYRTIKKWKNDGGTIKQKSKKSLVPIGIHWLKINKIKWTKSKKGHKMLHFQIYKSPENVGWSESGRSEKIVSFEPINCYHLISGYKEFELKEKWFNPVESCYTEAQLNMLFKMRNKPFKALIKHVEQEFNDHYFTRAEVRYVFQKDEKIDENNINYFELYERL